MIEGLKKEDVSDKEIQENISEREEFIPKKEIERKLWFQTTVKAKRGNLYISVFKISLETEGFELEISRGAAFETKIFMCSSVEQVWELHAIFVREIELYFGVLNRIGWVDEKGRRYPFKVGDLLVCEGQQIFELGNPLMEGEQVLLLNPKGELVNQCSARAIYRSLYGEENERCIATRRDITTAKLIYTRVIRLKSSESLSC